MRRLLLFVLLLLPAAFAQGRLNPPNYYLSQLPELLDGDVLRGELTTADGQNFKDGSYLDLYVMHGQAGEEVELVAASLEFDTYLSVYRPDGTLLDWIDDGYYSVDAELTLTLPETGRYLIVVSGYSDVDLGRYTLARTSRTLGGAGAATEIVVPGVYHGSYDPADTALVPYMEIPGAVLAFELSEPAALAFDLSSDSFDTYILVTDADGLLVTENDDANYSEASGWATDSLAFAEFAPGTYYVYVTSWYSTPNGEFTLSVRRFVSAD